MWFSSVMCSEVKLLAYLGCDNRMLHILTLIVVVNAWAVIFFVWRWEFGEEIFVDIVDDDQILISLLIVCANYGWILRIMEVLEMLKLSEICCFAVDVFLIIIESMLDEPISSSPK